MLRFFECLRADWTDALFLGSFSAAPGLEAGVLVVRGPGIGQHVTGSHKLESNKKNII
jgi:hypothetical protein